jgi:hypothetical protein
MSSAISNDTSQREQRRTGGHGHRQHKTLLEFSHVVDDRAGFQAACGATDETYQTSREGGELLGSILGEARRRRHEYPVG